MTPEPPSPDAPPPLVLPTRTGYDRWSATYDTDGNPLVALEEPCVERLLGPVCGLTVLDLGCGTGRHAFRLAAAGASVQAVDFSEGMLQQARAKPGAAGVAFHLHDLSQPLPFPAESFDRVICGLVLDHIADLPALFREMYRVCRRSGFVVVSVMHPAMMLRGVQARFHEPGSGHEIRPASQEHQMSDYILAAERADFAFDHLSEHAVDHDLANRLPRASKYEGWPMLLMMRLAPRPHTSRTPMV